MEIWPEIKMISKKTCLLTETTQIPAARLNGQEKLAGWSCSQQLIYEKPDSFQFSRIDSGVVSISTPESTLSLSKQSPLLTSCTKTSESYFDLMLLESEAQGAALGVVTNFTSMIQQGVYRFQVTKNARDTQETLEKYYILNRFTSKDTARFNLHLLACTYGLPVVELSAGWQGVSRDELPALFAKIDTSKNARRLKEEFQLTGSHFPHMQIVKMDEKALIRSHFIKLTVFGNSGGHVLDIHHLAQSRVSRAGVVTPVVTDSRQFLSLSEAITCIKNHYSGRYAYTILTMKLLKNEYYIVPASWVKRGMEVPQLLKEKIQKTRITEIDEENSPSLVYRILNKNQPVMIADTIIIPMDTDNWWKF